MIERWVQKLIDPNFKLSFLHLLLAGIPLSFKTTKFNRRMVSIAVGILTLFSVVSLFAQQVPDTLFSPMVANPAYHPKQGSVICIDEAHNNFHTMSGGFRPFANVLEKDGYIVRPLTGTFNAETLRPAKIVVVANAIHRDNLQRWTLPTPSVFTDDEINAINAWVKAGGSLLLIADHMPFPGAAEKLAASFGIKFYNGFARKEKNDRDIFKSGTGLEECAITKGRGDVERVTSVQTFTGQGFQVPEDAVRVITLNKDYEILLPSTAWEFTELTPRIPAEGFVQGAYLRYGSGRIAVFGEAAMFTAQRYGKNKFGMNAKTASQNMQFLLNTIHWLDGLID